MIRSLARTVGSLVAALIMASTFTGMAQGANFPYDGDHAYQDGCRADQEVIYHRYIRDSAGNLYGYVDLMYSPSCITTWAHVHADFAALGDTVQGTIIRNYDGKEYSCYGYNGTSDCWTPMVYDQNMTSYAVGVIQDPGNYGMRAATPSF